MTTDGGGWTLAMRVYRSSQEHQQTTALNKGDLIGTSSISRVAKISDAEYNTLAPAEVWNVCGSRQTLYRRNLSTPWYSNHGVATTCSYNRGFWNGIKASHGGTYVNSFDNQACGGGMSGGVWGVLSGIYATDSTNFGCYEGCTVGTTCTTVPSKYAGYGTGSWSSDGLVFLR